MCSRFEQNGQAVRPTDLATVLTPVGPVEMRWGLNVAWEARPLINARAETLESKPTFRRLLANRLTVAAGCWWEWRDRRKFRLGLADGHEMRFAGLADGERFVVLTRPAPAPLDAIHPRMPVVLTPEGAEAWLAGRTSVADLLVSPGLEYAAQACDPSPAQGELF